MLNQQKSYLFFSEHIKLCAMTENTTDTINQFIEQMGMIVQADGLPRIAGKVLGLLLVEDGPFSFGEIAERLAVSRGSISTNTRLLENLRVIDRVSKKGERGDYFQLAEDPYPKLLQGASQRMEKSISVLKNTRLALPSKLDNSKSRLFELENFYSEYLKSLALLIAKLKNK